MHDQLPEPSVNVTYREITYAADHARLASLVRYDLTNAAKTTLVKSTRDMQRARVRGAIAPKVAIQNGELVITVGTTTKVLSPNGQGLSYLWPSLSPDGKKIVYYVSGAVWTCNVDGSNVQRIGNFRAPQWYNNNVVVGMNDIDDGHIVTASSIVAYTLDGKKSQSRDQCMIAT